MTLCITGSESFIGRALIRRCREEGRDYVGLDSAAQPPHIKADIRDPQIAAHIPEGAEALIHLAAISRDPDCRADPLLAFDVNLQGTLNLIRAAAKRGVRQFIFASSEWVYGDVGNEGEQVESQPIDITRMRSEYAISKIAGEQMLKLAHSNGEFPAVTILRFGIVYGPRSENWSAVEALFHHVMTRDGVEVGSLRTGRRFIHVEDLVSGILAALGREDCATYNLSGDRIVTLGDVIDTSARLLGRSPAVTEKNPDAVSLRNPSNALAREALGWAPEYDLTRGLETLRDYFTRRQEEKAA